MNSTLVPSPSVDTYVLDSWPFLERELKAVLIPRMEELLSAASTGRVRVLINEMNFGEVFYLLAKRKGEAEAEAWLNLARRLPLEIVPVTSDQLWAAARLKAQTTLSYADCFCAVLARTNGAVVLTGDPDFLPLKEAGTLMLEWLGA